MEEGGAPASALSPGGEAALAVLADDELRQALETIGFGEFSTRVRARVLRQVGHDVALAVDWIMENGDELAVWMSEPEPAAATDASAGSASASDLNAEDYNVAPLGEEDYTVAPAGEEEPLPSSLPTSMDMHYGDSVEEDMDEDDQGEGEPDNDLARLLSHLREFSDLASMVSLQATAAQQGELGGAGGTGSAAVGPIFAVGEHVVLIPGAVRTSDGSRGPLRRGDVGQVIDVGETHVSVRALSATPAARVHGAAPAGGVIISGSEGLAGVLALGGALGGVASLPSGGVVATNRPWWYANSSLAVAPPQDAAAASAAAAAASAVADAASPERDCAMIRAPLADTAATVNAVRRIVARVSGADFDMSKKEELLKYCNKHNLLEALAEGMVVCCRPGVHGQVSTASATALDSLLMAAHVIAGALLLEKPKQPCEKEELAVGDAVKFKIDESIEESDHGVITDDLGFGQLCVHSTVSRVSYDVDRKVVRLSKRQQVAPGAESRVATGVLSYLNELLISRAVPLGDLSIVQRVLADGAQIEHADSEGNTPLLLCVDKGGSSDLMTVLLQHGASVNAENLAGRTPLAAAVEKDRTVLVKRLLLLDANPDKVSDEALSKSTEEIRGAIEEKRAAAMERHVEAETPSEKAVVMDTDAAVEACGIVQRQFVSVILPTLLRVHAMPPAGLPPQAERSLARVVVLVLEHLPAATELQAQINSVDVAGPAFAVVEDMVISQSPYDVLLALRLVQAVLRVDIAHAALVERYYVLNVVQELAQEKGSLYETLALQPPVAIAFAQQPAGAVLSNMLPTIEASAQGVALLARKLVEMISTALGGDRQENVIDNNNQLACNSCNWDPALTPRLSGGDTRALELLRDSLVLREGSFTSKELQATGMLDAIISFLEPSDSTMCPRRHAQFWKIMTESPSQGPGDTAAIWLLVRRLQKVLSRHESLEVPYQLGGAAALALGVDRGMRLLLEPHRVELVSIADLETATAAVAHVEHIEAATEKVQSAPNLAASLASGEAQVKEDADAVSAAGAKKDESETSGRLSHSPAKNFSEDTSTEHGVSGSNALPTDAGYSLTAVAGEASATATAVHEAAACESTAAAAAIAIAAVASAAAVDEVAKERAEVESKAGNAVSVLVEPLVPVIQLSAHVLRLSAIDNPSYEEYCQALVGTVVFDRPRVLLAEQAEPYRRAVVEGFRCVEPSSVGVHQLRYSPSVVLDANTPEESDERWEVVLGVRDYRLSQQRVPPSFSTERATLLASRAAAAWAEANEEEERSHVIVITYPHEAVPMDIFIDSVMGAVLQALRQADPGQTPYGKQYGDEYDFPSRGFADGQPEFQESLTRGLSEAPYEAPVARGQTRREAQVLVSRLNGICEASLKVDRSSSRHFMTPLQQGLEFTNGSRVHSKYGRIDSKGSLATVIARGRGVGGSVPKSASGADRYTMMYDDGVVVEAVPRNSMRPLAKRSAPAVTSSPAPGRLAFALGRVAPPSADEGPSNPAALSRVFKSFLRKGEDAVPVRYELTEDAAGITSFAASTPSPQKQRSPLTAATATDVAATAGAQEMGGLENVGGFEHFQGVRVYDPPLIEVAYALDPRDPTAVAVSTSSQAHTWHAVAMASQKRSLYEISNEGATVKKTEQDSFVDAIRTTAPLQRGVHRFRVRIDETAGEDFCNHMGFVAGDGYRGSALNSADSCCVEVDSGRISLDGRACSRISRRPVKGDVLVLQMNLESSQFVVGIEGEPLSSVFWTCQKRPVFLALSFRRVGWKVTMLKNSEAGAGDEMSRKEQATHDLALARNCLTGMDPSITLFQAMLEVVRAADAARANSTSQSHASSGEVSPDVVEAAQRSPRTESEGGGGKGAWSLAAASQLAMQAQARQPYRLVYQVRMHGLEQCLQLLSAHNASAAAERATRSEPAGCKDGRVDTIRRARRAQVWLEERPLGEASVVDGGLYGGCASGYVGSGDEAAMRATADQNDVLEQQLSAAGLSRDACRAARLLSILYRRDSTQLHSSNECSNLADNALHVPAAVAADAAVELGGVVEVANAHAVGVTTVTTKAFAAAPEALLSRKLTRKLSVVLGDVVSVASGCLPGWCQVLPSLCPFLFSFSAREQLLKCTAFGTSQTIFWLQEQRVDPILRRRLREAENTIGQVTEMSGDRAQRAYDRLLHAQEAIERLRIGKLRSDIARVTRDERILSQADTLMRVHANVTRMLEVQFVDEHGFGWGVTQGFYTAVALELQRADDKLVMWRATSQLADSAEMLVASPTSPKSQTVNRVYLQVGAEGLFPRPMRASDPQLPEICDRMRLLGRLIAKALRDGFNVPLPLSPAFFAAALLGKSLTRAHLPLESSTGGLARSMANLLEIFEMLADPSRGLSGAQLRAARQAVLDGPCTLLVPQYTGATLSVSDYILAADSDWPAFIDPAGLVVDPHTGEPVELCAGGAGRRLVAEEAVLREWVELVVRLWLRDGVALQLAAFRSGVEDVLSVEALSRFSELELQRMLCGHQQVVWNAYLGSGDWLGGVVNVADEKKALEQHLVMVGFGSNDPPIRTLLVDELVSMDNERRTKFLDLVTANPRLPCGGLPQAAIKVASRAGARTVWAQTCVRTLYLPNYATQQELHDGLEEAFANAALGGFHEKNLAV